MRLLEGEETLRNQDFEETLVFLKQENHGNSDFEENLLHPK